MKTYLYTFAFGLLLLASACNKEETAPEPAQPGGVIPGEENPAIPEGYFIATFSTPAGQDMITRAPITGKDKRVQYLRYIVYKSTGEFVKEKVILKPSGTTPEWPMTQVRDTLPKDSYTAVFLGNTEKTLFPFSVSGVTTYADVLTNYTSTFADARIILPNAEMSDSTEYYMAKASFSNLAPNASVTLQRIISMLRIHRDFVDAQAGLNSLVKNITDELKYKNLLTNTVNTILPGKLFGVLDKGLLNSVVYGLVGGIDSVVNNLTRNLTDTIVGVLYQNLLKELTNEIGSSLKGDASQAGALSALAVILNPWSMSEAQTAIVTINNFPRSMDLNLTVKDYFVGNQRFRYNFPTANIYDDKSLYIKGFNDNFQITNVNVIKNGLISGLLIDQIIDNGLILDGAFIDIKDPFNGIQALNIRNKANYTFISLGLKSYANQGSAYRSLTLNLQLSTLPGLTDIVKGIPLLGPILNTIVNLIITPIGTINISVSPVNLPLVGVENLSLKGGWTAQSPY